jgi:hypothetical protein
MCSRVLPLAWTIQAILSRNQRTCQERNDQSRVAQQLGRHPELFRQRIHIVE